jgi:hypothetical protein
MKKKNYLSMIVLWVIEIENGTIGQIWKKTEILLLVRPLPSLMFPSLSTLPQFILYCIHLVVVGSSLAILLQICCRIIGVKGNPRILNGILHRILKSEDSMQQFVYHTASVVVVWVGKLSSHKRRKASVCTIGF